MKYLVLVVCVVCAAVACEGPVGPPGAPGADAVAATSWEHVVAPSETANLGAYWCINIADPFFDNDYNYDIWFLHYLNGLPSIQIKASSLSSGIAFTITVGSGRLLMTTDADYAGWHVVVYRN